MTEEHFLELLDRAIENDELTEHEDENYYGYE